MTSDFRVRVIFVQIKCRPGAAYKVAERIVDTVEATSEIYSTSGSFDLLAKFQLPSGIDPGHFVTSVVQPIEDVGDTYTIIGFNAFTPETNPS
jgi:DNA-binding Lrp family transcriptional regulator